MDKKLSNDDLEKVLLQADGDNIHMMHWIVERGDKAAISYLEKLILQKLPNKLKQITQSPPKSGYWDGKDEEKWQAFVARLEAGASSSGGHFASPVNSPSYLFPEQTISKPTESDTDNNEKTLHEELDEFLTEFKMDGNHDACCGNEYPNAFETGYADRSVTERLLTKSSDGKDIGQAAEQSGQDGGNATPTGFSSSTCTDDPISIASSITHPSQVSAGTISPTAKDEAALHEELDKLLTEFKMEGNHNKYYRNEYLNAFETDYDGRSVMDRLLAKGSNGTILPLCLVWYGNEKVRINTVRFLANLGQRDLVRILLEPDSARNCLSTAVGFSAPEEARLQLLTLMDKKLSNDDLEKVLLQADGDNIHMMHWIVKRGDKAAISYLEGLILQRLPNKLDQITQSPPTSAFWSGEDEEKWQAFVTRLRAGA
jgi:hypothetical protein